MRLYAEIFSRSYDVTRRIEGYYTPSDVIAAGDKILQNFVNSYMYKRTLFTNDLFDCGISLSHVPFYMPCLLPEAAE